MTLSSLINYGHSRYLAALSIKRHIENEDFGIAYKLATDEEKEIIIKAIENCNIITTIAWTKRILKKHKQYDYLDISTLRRLAAETGIVGYSSLDKSTLVGILICQKA